MIVPRPFVDLLDISGTSYADVLADIVRTRSEFIAKRSYDDDHLFKFRSFERSFSTAYGANFNQPALGAVTEGLPAFAGSHDGTALDIGFIDYGKVRYIVKGSRIEIVLLKTKLPTTILQAVNDDPLDHILRHPMIGESRSIIRKARQSGDSVALDCSRDLVEIDSDGRIIRELDG